MPGEIGQSVLDNLIWALLIGVVPLMLIAWRFTFNVSMSKAQLLEIQATIKARKFSEEQGRKLE